MLFLFFKFINKHVESENQDLAKIHIEGVHKLEKPFRILGIANYSNYVKENNARTQKFFRYQQLPASKVSKKARSWSAGSSNRREG